MVNPVTVMIYIAVSVMILISIQIEHEMHKRLEKIAIGNPFNRLLSGVIVYGPLIMVSSILIGKAG